jgi:AcrR family transcriptional regulator
VGIAERREREKEGLRRRILDAARELFMRHGYERVTMRAIAEAIEYSPTAIYQHFADKDALVDALCSEDFSTLLGAISGEALPADPIARIRALGLAYAQFGLTHPNHYRFMFMTPIKPHEHDEQDDPGLQSYLMLREAVEQGIAQGRLRDVGVDTAAQVLWASIHGAVALLVAYPPDCFPHAPAAPDLVEQVVDNGLRGLTAR